MVLLLPTKVAYNEDMKIAYIANVIETVPPPAYSAIEWITYYLAQGLAKKGHQVDLYASADSKKSDTYTLIPIAEKRLREEPWFNKDAKMRDVSTLLAMSKAAKAINEKDYDIVHNHVDRAFMYYAPFMNKQIITTCHSALSPAYRTLFYQQHKTMPYISISLNQRKDMPDLNYVANIYHGIDLSLFPYNEVPTGNYMAVLARMIPEKGILEAAMLTQKVPYPLHIAAKVDPIADKAYFEKVKPLFDDNHCVFIGELDAGQRTPFLQHAKCLLAPIQWEEPFGLMFIEAMACATPVIAFARGSVPEIIKDGQTGFIVNASDDDVRGNWIVKKTGLAGLCEAVEKLYSLSPNEYTTMRKNARQHVEENFTVQRMVDHYELVYKKILGQ